MEKSCTPWVCWSKGAQRINRKTHEAWRIRRAAVLETKLKARGEQVHFKLVSFGCLFGIDADVFHHACVLGTAVGGLVLSLQLRSPPARPCVSGRGSTRVHFSAAGLTHCNVFLQSHLLVPSEFGRWATGDRYLRWYGTASVKYLRMTCYLPFHFDGGQLKAIEVSPEQVNAQ